MNTSYLKNKADHYEVYRVNLKNLTANITMGKLDSAVDGESEGLAITVIKNKKLGFAFTDSINDFKKTADKALSVARANNRDENLRGFVKPQNARAIRNYDKELTGYSLGDLARFKTGFLKETRSADKKIMLSNATYKKAIEKVNIINSEGVDLEQTSAMNVFSYEFILKRNGELISAGGQKEDIKPLDFGFAKEEAKRVTALVGKRYVKTMNCPAIFHPEATAPILSQTFAPNINAENVQQKRSILAGMLNKKIASSALTIIDDATTKGLIATTGFDCEGTPSQRNTIVDKGVLKTFLYNNYTAQKEGKKSTGNATRSSFTIPSIGTNNIIVAAGKQKNLLEGIKKGIYVREMLGVHTMNPLTGDFSLGLLEGFYIENGKIKHPIRNAMIAGNLYKMLNQITGIGIKILHASGATYLPEIRFGNIKLVGKD